MSRFSDEMLSAYLDGELSAAERTAVESHLATCEGDRRLLEELQSLRSELQTLPRAPLPEGFAGRVVEAAIAAKACQQANVAPVSITVTRHESHRWPYLAAALAAGTIIVAVLIVQNWNSGEGNVVLDPATTRPEDLDPTGIASADGPTGAQSLIEKLRQAAPDKGEAVVLRVRVPKGTPLGQTFDVALAEAGIAQRPPTDTTTHAIGVGYAYRKQLADKFGGNQPGAPNPALRDATSAVSEAIFVEASLEQIEAALAALASDDQRQIDLAAEARLAAADLPKPPDSAEGEAGSENRNQPLAQRLNAGMFRLEKRSAAPPGAASPPTLDPKQPVKVLILVEQTE